jgi:hypothetical protein
VGIVNKLKELVPDFDLTSFVAKTGKVETGGIDAVPPSVLTRFSTQSIIGVK